MAIPLDLSPAADILSKTHIVDSPGFVGHRHIQDAIDASSAGDRVLLRQGVHRARRSANAVVSSRLPSSAGLPRTTSES